jgi:hypothetical protein
VKNPREQFTGDVWFDVIASPQEETNAWSSASSGSRPVLAGPGTALGDVQDLPVGVP